MDLSKVKAVVTGGASGLGEATVRRIVKSGGKAAIFDLNADRAKKLIDELGKEFVIYIETDVTNGSQVEQSIDKAVEQLGGINLVVNCAGIGTPGKVLSKGTPIALDQFEKVIKVNLVGSFNVIRVAASAMQKNKPNEEG
ncbi:MAG: SDR family NAD(P)-dependent oxidoreductase, partial [Planococcus donghaensis]